MLHSVVTTNSTSLKLTKNNNKKPKINELKHGAQSRVCIGEKKHTLIFKDIILVDSEHNRKENMHLAE